MKNNTQKKGLDEKSEGARKAILLKNYLKHKVAKTFYDVNVKNT